jgi:ABC-type glycerol-3-phosphate transport system substrate-binding protein
MKKVIAILALASLMVACGGKGTTETTEGTDSLVVVEEEVVVDTTAAEAPVVEPAVQ